MELTEDELFVEYSKQSMHCMRNTLLPYDPEKACFSCGYNGIKTKLNLIKYKLKHKKFTIRLKFAEKW